MLSMHCCFPPSLIEVVITPPPLSMISQARLPSSGGERERKWDFRDGKTSSLSVSMFRRHSLCLSSLDAVSHKKRQGPSSEGIYGANNSQSGSAFALCLAPMVGIISHPGLPWKHASCLERFPAWIRTYRWINKIKINLAWWLMTVSIGIRIYDIVR